MKLRTLCKVTRLPSIVPLVMRDSSSGQARSFEGERPCHHSAKPPNRSGEAERGECEASLPERHARAEVESRPERDAQHFPGTAARGPVPERQRAPERGNCEKEGGEQRGRDAQPAGAVRHR